MALNDSKELTYFSAYNEYCEVYVKGAYVNIKLIIENGEREMGLY